ncbi:MAG: PilN domain-containing protein [Desulfobulbaceae bacterium]|nr:PilN domain-containing protein [Desulfobulbaceae bacterium]HIJ91730.1 PilN domain-containing protein [Deltaproteobacteria bacterium]
MLERINLVPRETATGNVWLAVYVSVAVVFVLSCFSVYLIRQSTVRKIGEIETKMNALSQYKLSAVNIQKNVHDLAEVVRQKKAILNTLSSEAERVKGVGSKKYVYSMALRSIAMELPGSVRCNDISFVKGDGSIAGEAMSYEELPGFVDKLKRHDIFERVSLIEIDRGMARKSSGSYSFKIEFSLKQKTTSWPGEDNG